MADSTQKKKKNYIKGGAKTVTFNNGSKIINLDIKGEGKLFTKDGAVIPNEGGYFKITLSELENVDQFGNSYSIYENDFKPDPKMSKAPRRASVPSAVEDDKSDVLPWDVK